MRPLAWLVSAALLVQSTATVDVETLTCSTWRQITTCQSPSGLHLHRIAMAGHDPWPGQRRQPLDHVALAGLHHHNGHAA